MATVTVLGMVPSMVQKLKWTLPLNSSLDCSSVQISEVGYSVALKNEGLRHCLDKHLTQVVTITSIATVRHTVGASLMKKEYSLIDHQYDVCHIVSHVQGK